MNRKDMKKRLKELAKPIKSELFTELFTKEELALMSYLYLDKVDQWWAADELGISVPTLTKWHKNCLDQVVSYFNFEYYKFKSGEMSKFERYFQDSLQQ